MCHHLLLHQTIALFICDYDQFTITYLDLNANYLNISLRPLTAPMVYTTLFFTRCYFIEILSHLFAYSDKCCILAVIKLVSCKSWNSMLFEHKVSYIIKAISTSLLERPGEFCSLAVMSFRFRIWVRLMIITITGTCEQHCSVSVKLCK